MHENTVQLCSNGGILDIGYRLERNFCQSLFLRIGDFLCFRELIFAIGTDWFFCRDLIFVIFIKYPVPSINNIFVFIEYVQ